MTILMPGDGPGSPVATAHADHQPCVPTTAGVPPYCSCGLVGGNGIDRPLLADHLREVDSTYGLPGGAPMSARTGWLAAAGQIVGTVDEYSTVYDWDGGLYPSSEAAISAGFERFGSDDFNVGRIESGRLVWWGWMDKEDRDQDRVEIAEALSLDGAR